MSSLAKELPAAACIMQSSSKELSTPTGYKKKKEKKM